MTIDTTYSFFSAPDMETLPPLPKSRKYVKRESTRMSQPEIVTYHPTAQTNAVEEWLLDASYGFFSSPSLHPEPIFKEKKRSATVATPPLHPKQVDYEGYSYFGI